MIPENVQKNDVCSIRFSPDFQERIAVAVPHKSGNFSAQVKYLVEVGLSRKDELPTPAQMEKTSRLLDQVEEQLRRIGNNLNQIARNMNAGIDVPVPDLDIASEDLRKEHGEVRRMVRLLRDQG